MTTNQNTARQHQRKAKRREQNLRAFERGDAEVKPLDEAAKSGLYRVLRAADKHMTIPWPGFVEFERPKIIQVIYDED
jgi:hypothetical protein